MVIYVSELIQTEINYVRTLKIMQGVFAWEMRGSLQMDESRLQRLLPPVDGLLSLHQHFLGRLKERRQQSLEPDSESNYCMQRLGDILCAQVTTSPPLALAPVVHLHLCAAPGMRKDMAVMSVSMGHSYVESCEVFHSQGSNKYQVTGGFLLNFEHAICEV